MPLSAVMLSTACLHGFNTLIVANVISAALLLFTYADKVSFIARSTMVISAMLCPLPIAVSTSQSPIRALSSTDRWSVMSVNSVLYLVSGGLAIAPDSCSGRQSCLSMAPMLAIISAIILIGLMTFLRRITMRS
jgi:hypothetical protein